MSEVSIKYHRNQDRGLKLFLKLVRRDWLLIMCCLPALSAFIVFYYLPMAGVYMAFTNFKINLGIFGSPFIGIKWFMQFFNSPFFLRLLRNTLTISVYSLLWGFWVPILFAIMLNEISGDRFRRIVQSISYFPYFISVVVVVGIMVNMFGINDGVINAIRDDMGLAKIDFMKSVQWFRTMYIGSGIWQGFGFSAVIYIGAISSIDPQLYEAATVDGASRLRRIWHITLPGILPVAITLLILAIGGMINVGFEKIILMYDGANYEVSDVISTYVYRRGLVGGEYSFGAAIGLFNSVANLIMITAANIISRRVSGVYLW